MAALLHEAAETHHTVYRITDGDDSDWASWYADWLLKLSELPKLLGRTPESSPRAWCSSSAVHAAVSSRVSFLSLSFLSSLRSASSV
jgi:hypothetical protein